MQHHLYNEGQLSLVHFNPPIVLASSCFLSGPLLNSFPVVFF